MVQCWDTFFLYIYVNDTEIGLRTLMLKQWSVLELFLFINVNVLMLKFADDTKVVRDKASPRSTTKSSKQTLTRILSGL